VIDNTQGSTIHTAMSLSTLRRSDRGLFSLLAVILLSFACDSSPTGPSPIEPGVWGGEHAALTVAATGSHLEFDCAHGDIPGALEADHGKIAANGTFTREHGGPIRVDEVADRHPAIYSGTVSTNTMQLTIRLTDSSDVIGTFSLTRGMAGRVFKCL